MITGVYGIYWHIGIRLRVNLNRPMSNLQTLLSTLRSNSLTNWPLMMNKVFIYFMLNPTLISSLADSKSLFLNWSNALLWWRRLNLISTLISLSLSGQFKTTRVNSNTKSWLKSSLKSTRKWANMRLDLSFSVTVTALLCLWQQPSRQKEIRNSISNPRESIL